MENLRAIGWMVLAMAAFAVEDALIKQIALSLPTGQILIVLGIGGSLVFGLLARRHGIVLISPVLRHPAVIARNSQA
jgi:hypothetical protein